MPPLGTTAGPFKFLPFVGGAISTGAGFAVGTVTAPTLRPILQDLENRTWAVHRVRPLDAEIAAAIVAEDVDKYQWGEDEAGKTGISADNFRDLHGEALNAPGLGPLFELWRRGLISDAEFAHGLRKAKLEGRWDGPLEGLRDTLLASAELAMLQQQGFITADRANAEGRLQGVTNERQQLRFEASGLPPGVAEALTMLRRKIINPSTFAQIVREGHTKTKYTDELLELERTLLSVTQYVDAHLRGYITEAEMYEGTALWGLTRADTDTIFQSHGRPLTVHQVTTGLARGGKYDGPIGDIPDAFLNSLRQGSIKPPWYDLAYANRYTYPSAFVMRGLAQSGARSQAQIEQALRFIGWPPDWAKDVSEFWASGGTATADPHVTKAHNSLWTTMVASYTAAESDAAALGPGFDILDVPQAARTEIIATLDVRRDLIRKQLTPSQIKKAYQKAAPNEATGQPWTYDDALAAMLSRGWSHADATTFLKT